MPFLDGIKLAIPVRLVEAALDADPADPAEIEITPAELGMRWPRLDAGVYVPCFLGGTFGSRA